MPLSNQISSTYLLLLIRIIFTVLIHSNFTNSTFMSTKLVCIHFHHYHTKQIASFNLLINYYLNFIAFMFLVVFKENTCFLFVKFVFIFADFPFINLDFNLYFNSLLISNKELSSNLIILISQYSFVALCLSFISISIIIAFVMKCLFGNYYYFISHNPDTTYGN